MQSVCPSPTSNGCPSALSPDPRDTSPESKELQQRHPITKGRGAQSNPHGYRIRVPIHFLFLEPEVWGVKAETVYLRLKVPF